MTLRASSMVPRRATKLSQVKLRSLWSLWLQGGPEAADAWPSTLDIELIGSHLVNLCHNLCLGSIFCTQDKLPDTFAPTADERDMRDARRVGALQNSHANVLWHYKLIRGIIPKDWYWNWQGWIKMIAAKTSEEKMLCFFSRMKPAILILTMSFKVARTSDFLFSHFHVIHPRTQNLHLSLWQRGFEAASKCSASSCQGQSRGGRTGSSELACIKSIDIYIYIDI